MEAFIKPILESTLFHGMSQVDALAALRCLGARTKNYARGEEIISSASICTSLGVIVHGRAFSEQIDYWGNRHIIAQLGQSSVFGETFACANQASSVCLRAEEDCTVLLMQVQRILSTCSACCSHHTQLIRNLLLVLAQKNQHFLEKTSILSQRSTREKILTYLSIVANRTQSTSFEIPFNRQALADFLGVERSALSLVLGKLQKEGVLRFEKNHFVLLRGEEE